MNLIINIPAEIYKGIKKDRVLDTSLKTIFNSIKNGNIIPFSDNDWKDLYYTELIQHNWDNFECTNCHNKDGMFLTRQTNYCPDCGLKIKGVII